MQGSAGFGPLVSSVEFTAVRRTGEAASSWPSHLCRRPPGGLAILGMPTRGGSPLEPWEALKQGPGCRQRLTAHPEAIRKQVEGGRLNGPRLPGTGWFRILREFRRTAGCGAASDRRERTGRCAIRRAIPRVSRGRCGPAYRVTPADRNSCWRHPVRRPRS